MAFRRTLLVGAVAAATFAATAGAGGAQEGRTVDAGTAKAQGTVLEIAPAAGSLAFAITTGMAIAETSGGLGQSLAQTFDLGLIGSALTAESCDGDDGVVAPEQLPQATRVDNRSGDAALEETEASPIPGMFSIGTKTVAATVQPSATASIVAGDVALGPLLRLAGGRAGAEAEVFPGAGREARSWVEVDLDLAGAIQLQGMRWDARHRTGGEDGADGSFTIDALDVLGVPLPVDDLRAAQDAINAALAPTGFRVELPRVERIETPVDLVRVTPLRLLVADSQLGAAGVRPALDLTRDVRAQLFDALTAAACQLASVLLIGEIGIGVASGTGSLVAEIGGVEARSATVVVEDPFGTVAPPALGDIPPVAEIAAPGAAPRIADVDTDLAGAGVPPAEVAVDAASPVVEVCESEHPLRKTACSTGAAAAVGVIGGAATAATALADLRRRRAPRAVAVDA
jgi:hypothetical protein